jgi:hypothetical protein
MSQGEIVMLFGVPCHAFWCPMSCFLVFQGRAVMLFVVLGRIAMLSGVPGQGCHAFRCPRAELLCFLVSQD